MYINNPQNEILVLRYKSNKICKSYKTVMNEIKDLNKWRVIHVLRQEDQYSVMPNMICMFKAIPVKIPANYFTVISRLVLSFLQRGKKTKNRQHLVLKEKNKVGRLTLPDFKTYYKTIVVQTVWYQQKNTQNKKAQKQTYVKMAS